jgi:hypothetical protein
MSNEGKLITGDLSSFSITIKSPKRYSWKPREDITAYELALCLPILMGNGWDIEPVVHTLPENARRHFEEA